MATRSNLTQRIGSLLNTRQKQSYALVAGTVLIQLLLIFGGVFPVISSILFQLEQNGTKSAILAQMETKETNLRTLINTETQKRPVTLALNAALPDGIDQSEFLDSINELAAKNSGVLIFLSFSEIPERRDLQQIFFLGSKMDGMVVTIGANGSRSGLQAFFAEVEAMRRVVNVTSFSLSRREENDLEPIKPGEEYNLNIQAELYFTGE